MTKKADVLKTALKLPRMAINVFWSVFDFVILRVFEPVLNMFFDGFDYAHDKAKKGITRAFKPEKAKEDDKTTV